MAKFIRIKNSLINIDKVTNFELDQDEIWVFFDDSPSDPMKVTCTNKQQAYLIFEDIPHLIDNTHIPAFVRQEEQRRNEARAALSAIDYYNWDDPSYDKLPF